MRAPEVEWVLAIGGLVVASLAVIHLFDRPAARIRCVAGLVARHGLTPLTGPGNFKLGAEGRIDGHEVEIAFVLGPDDGGTTSQTHVTVATSLPADTHIAPPGPETALWGGAAIKLGDPSFDDARATWSRDLVGLFATLGASARAALLADAPGKTRVIIGGKLRDEHAGFTTGAAAIDGAISAATDAARRLRGSSAGHAARLAHHVAHDPAPAFRVRCLELLGLHFRDSVETREALDGARRSPFPALRLAAARLLPPSEARALLVDELASSPDDYAFALPFEALLAHGTAPPERHLARALTGPPTLRVLAARALALRAGPGDEDRLLDLLTADDDEVDIAAAEALAAVGTVRAVELLMEHTRGLFADRQLKGAARMAIAAIQARAGGDAGRLSVVAADEGALALVGHAQTVSQVVVQDAGEER